MTLFYSIMIQVAFCVRQLPGYAACKHNLAVARAPGALLLLLLHPTYHSAP